jgi:hypothetical protein
MELMSLSEDKEEHLRDLASEADRRSLRAFDVWREWLLSYSELLVQESIDAMIKHDPVRGKEFAEVLKDYWGLKK